MSNTYYQENTDGNHLILLSGQFETTVKASYTIASGISAGGAGWDGDGALWSNVGTDDFAKQSGSIESTQKWVTDVSTLEGNIEGVAWTGFNYIWVGISDDKIYTASFNELTLKDSTSIGGIDNLPFGVDVGAGNTPWCGLQADKLYLASNANFPEVTLKTSMLTGTLDATPTGVSWDGTDTPWTGTITDKLYLGIGQFELTLKSSLHALETTDPRGVGDSDNDARLAVPGGGTSIPTMIHNYRQRRQN